MGNGGYTHFVVFVLGVALGAPKRQPIKNKKERKGLGLHWPSFHWTMQQPTGIWHLRYIEYRGGSVTVVECVGGAFCHQLGWQIN